MPKFPDQPGIVNNTNGNGTGESCETRTQRADELGAFVTALRALRRAAGDPPYRLMAKTANYSHTALSSAVSGGRLPSLELTLGFVRACDGDELEWEARWHRANRRINPPAMEPPAIGTVRTPRRRLRARAIVIGALCLCLALAGTVIAASVRSRPDAGRSALPSDGADPKQAGCDADAVNLDTVSVTSPTRSEQVFGHLTLRYSPHCHGAWPLFFPTPLVAYGSTVHLETQRRADGARARFDYPYATAGVTDVYGNLLRTTQGCASVTAEILDVSGAKMLAAGTTRCLESAAS